jgi:hypothetical protein
MKYYLAGKMTGKPNFGYEDFAEAADNLRKAGFDIASPHEIDYDEVEHPRGSLPYKVYIQNSLNLLFTCNAIILLPDWINSRGARIERDVAIASHMSVFDYAKPNRIKPHNAELIPTSGVVITHVTERPGPQVVPIFFDPRTGQMRA